MTSPEKYKRYTWWQDADSDRTFLLVGIDYLEEKENHFADLWEVGMTKSKYVAFHVFDDLVQSRKLIHIHKEQPYKSYLHGV